MQHVSKIVLVLSCRHNLMKHRISYLFPQCLSWHNVDLPAKTFLKEQTEAHQIQQISVLLKIYENINIAFFVLLTSHNRPEDADLSDLVLRQMAMKRLDGVYYFVLGIHDCSELQFLPRRLN